MRFQNIKYFFVFFLLILGLFFIPSVESTNAQPLGCCTNSGDNQCRTNTPCGPGAGSTCQVTDFICRNAPANEGGNMANNWIEGETCLITGTQRQCGDNDTDCCYSSVVGCCQLPNGTLMQETELQCAIDQGTYLNEGACQVGCCQVADQCTDAVTEAECTRLQGTYGGDGVQCGTDPCVAPTGCCQVGDMCSNDVTQTECTEGQGIFGGVGVQCGTDPCVPPPATGCCQVADQCTDAVTQAECTRLQGTYGGDGVQCGTDPCVPPTGCCVIDNQCTESVTQDECDGGVFQIDGICGRGECITQPEGCCVEGDQCSNDVLESDCSGNFELDGTCGVECVVTPVETGCCVENNECSNNVEAQNCTGTFDLGQICGQGLCVLEPEGCCVCGDSECSITTEEECNDMDGCKYLGDDTNCEGVDECSDVPGCCFLDVNGGASNLANRQVDPNKCIETTASICNLEGGDFQGVGTSCMNDFPEECSYLTRNVPTLSQWGLIATAGMLGIFSLIILIRRQRYNLS